MNLEVKLAQLKAANERLNDAFKQSRHQIVSNIIK